jgi:transcriptional regulator with XRE-family HTH domain
MNMSAKKIDLLISELEDALKFENYEDRIEVKASFIQLDILHEVTELMKNSKSVSSKTELAKRLGKSKGFVSQLFSGDKALNLKMIAQLQEIFDVKFVPSFKENASFRTKNFTKDIYLYNGDYHLDEIKVPIYDIAEYQKTG